MGGSGGQASPSRSTRSGKKPGGLGPGTGGNDPCFQSRIVILVDTLHLLNKQEPQIDIGEPVEISEVNGIFHVTYLSTHIGNLPLTVAPLYRACLEKGVSYSATIYSFAPELPRVEIFLVRQ